MAEQASKSTLIIQKTQRSTTECSAVNIKISHTKATSAKIHLCQLIKKKSKQIKCTLSLGKTSNVEEKILFLTDL
jgi:hypothetical protein